MFFGYIKVIKKKKGLESERNVTENLLFDFQENEMFYYTFYINQDNAYLVLSTLVFHLKMSNFINFFLFVRLL